MAKNKPLVIAKREIKSMLKERSLALIITVELLLVIFSGLLNVGYVLLTSPESSEQLTALNTLLAVGIVSDTPEYYVNALGKSKIPYVIYSDLKPALSDFNEGLIDVVLIGDLDLEQNASLMQMYLPENSPKIDLIKLGLRQAVMNLEQTLRRDKMEKYEPSIQLLDIILPKQSKSKEVEIYYVFTLPLLLFLPSLIAGSLVIDSITEDIENKTILNLKEAPITNTQIVAGKGLGAFIICAGQSVAWLTILSFLGLGIKNQASLLLISLLYTFIFTAMGAFTALKLKNLKNSQVVHTVISMGAISLFSPIAATSSQLTLNSPSYLLTGVASGNSIVVFAPQIIFLFMLATVGMVVAKSAVVEVDHL